MKIIYTLIMITALLMTGCSETKYPDGRDTVESFGDGRYQVLRGPDEQRIFYDVEKQVTILDLTMDWKMSKGMAFLVGLRSERVQYVILNIKNAEISRYERIKNIPKSYQAKFEE